MPFRPGDRVEARTALGRVPAVVVAVYTVEGAGPAVYVVETEPPAGGFPRLVLGAAHRGRPTGRTSPDSFPPAVTCTRPRIGHAGDREESTMGDPFESARLTAEVVATGVIIIRVAAVVVVGAALIALVRRLRRHESSDPLSVTNSD
jgi:hypothetical protein